MDRIPTIELVAEIAMAQAYADCVEATAPLPEDAVARLHQLKLELARRFQTSYVITGDHFHSRAMRC